jgi:hypothetical protein
MNEMKHQPIDDAARVWIVTRGPDGRLKDELDNDLLRALADTDSAEEISAALIERAGELQIAATRDW